MKCLFLWMLFCWLLHTAVNAQFSAEYRRAADGYFARGDYASAVVYYERFLEKGDRKSRQGEYGPYTAARVVAGPKALPAAGKEQAIYRLAESWRLLKNYEKAAPAYQQLTERYAVFPLVLYHYATCLRALGQYEAAEKALQQFLNTYEGEESYKTAALHEVRNLVYIQEGLKKDTSDYAIYALSAGRQGASYAPVSWLQDTLLFTATWPDSSAAVQRIHLNRLYKAYYKDGYLGDASRAVASGTLLHEGAASISADGNTLYLTRWTVNNGQKVAGIYRSRRTLAAAISSWSEPVILDSVINIPGANTQQPFLMPDGRHLLYASDRPGGFGGYDLWIAELDALGRTIQTTNMGAVINTAWNEQAPYYHLPSATLVFATDGRTGMGGYDLFYTTGIPGNWRLPLNFGYPVNSIKDDLYFTSYSKGRRILDDVVLSSDRSDVCCLELFRLQKKIPAKQVTGQVVACDTRLPLPGVTVEVTDTVTGIKLFTGITDTAGRYSFTVDHAPALNSITALKGYYTAATPVAWVTATNLDEDSLHSLPVCMEKEIVEEVTVLNNVYYEFGRAEILPASYPALDEVVALLNRKPGIKVEIGGHTDSKGSDALNLKLSEDRAASVVTYLVNKGIDKNRLSYKGYGAFMPVAPNTHEDGTDNPEGREKNRRTEMKVLKN